MRLYDGNDRIAEEFIMEPRGDHPMMQIEDGQWHSLEVLEERTVGFEAQNRRYGALAEEDVKKQ